MLKSIIKFIHFEIVFLESVPEIFFFEKKREMKLEGRNQCFVSYLRFRTW